MQNIVLATTWLDGGDNKFSKMFQRMRQNLALKSPKKQMKNNGK